MDNMHPDLAALAAALAADAAEHARVEQATAFARAWAAVGEALL
jgi:hypothetical protein